MSAEVRVIDHPFIQHKLTLMRKKETPCDEFRRFLREISLLMAYEMTREIPVAKTEIETPLQKMMAPKLDKDIVLISILRAGNGLLDGMLELIPTARVGHIGLYREPKTFVTVEYYFKVPPDLSKSEVFVLDPMLATGNSAIAAIQGVQQLNPGSVSIVSLIAAPQGIENFQTQCPGVPIYTCSIEEGLDDKGYILPGLGDAGDRLYATQ